jgi:hypothetical protein
VQVEDQPYWPNTLAKILSMLAELTVEREGFGDLPGLIT